MNDARFALFVMLGQTAERLLTTLPDIAPSEPMLLGPAYDLSVLMPDVVRQAEIAAEGYSLFFVFEAYVRDLVVDVLSKASPGDWWAKVPKDVQDEVAKLEETEEAKRWMALGSRDKSALMTYPQLLRVIDHNWKPDFEELLRDKSLIQEARVINHLRNTLCHMTPISAEEMERVRQALRDWFRMVAP
jgi:Swt1-like HEPN